MRFTLYQMVHHKTVSCIGKSTIGIIQGKSFGAAAGAEDKIFRKIYLGDESLKRKIRGAAETGIKVSPGAEDEAFNINP